MVAKIKLNLKLYDAEAGLISTTPSMMQGLPSTATQCNDRFLRRLPNSRRDKTCEIKKLYCNNPI